PRLVRAMPFLKPRAVTFPDLADGAIYLLVDEPEMDEKAASKFLTAESVPHLGWLADAVTGVEPFTDAALSAKVEAAMEAAGLTMKQVAQPARVALTGRTKSPGLFEVMELLGREATLSRLERAIARAKA